MSKRGKRISRSVIIVLLLLVGGWWWRYTHRPIPRPVRRTLFQGITYVREIRRKPRQNIVHVVTVKLDAPGISFLVTPPDDLTNELPLKAQTVSHFLKEFDVQVAINGDFFTPWWSNGILDYYPHVGDPVRTWGFASSRGIIYAKGTSDRPTLYISQDNRASFGKPIGKVYNAISGDALFIKNGKAQPTARRFHRDLHPRTAVALDKDAKRLIIVLVDGRQPNYSEGVTVPELAEIVIQHGGYNALNLDGGGSTTLVIEGKNGKPVQLNSPINFRIPHHERPVANHLGIFARRVE